jgi:altronate dehydratase
MATIPITEVRMAIMELKFGLLVHADDNVATLFGNDIGVGDEVTIHDKFGKSDHINTNAVIPYGHKIAVRDIAAGLPIMKYGEKIGLASAPIKRGDHVHVHNLDSDRGRGDR